MSELTVELNSQKSIQRNGEIGAEPEENVGT